MATTLFQAISAVPGRVYTALGEFVDYATGRKAEREAERNQKDLVDFFSEKLVSAFRAGRIRMLPYYDNLTAETPEHRLAYRWLLKEPVIKSAFMGKLLAVMSLDLQVDPASETPRDKEIAAFVEESLRRCAGGPAEIIWSILFGALLEGNGIAEKVWGRIDRGKYRGRPTVRAIKAKDSHDYQIEIDEFNNPVLVRSRRTNDEFPMSDFTFFSHMAAFSNPIGMSDLRAVYRAGWMLDTVWKLRAIGLERFTLPIFMSKYPQGRLDIRDSINDAVKKAKSLGYLTVPQEAAVEAIEMASKSGSDFDAAIKGLQEECFIAIQGATLQALAGNVTEGRGDSTVHKTTSELFVWYLSCAAATVINDQLIPDIVDINYADSDYPTTWLGGVNDGDLKSALELDTGLLQLGLVQDPHDLARRYRRQLSNDPQEALATLKLIRQLGAPEQPPPGMGGGLGGFGGPPGGGGDSVPPVLPGGDQFADTSIQNIQTAPIKRIMEEGGRSSEQSPFGVKDGDGEWEEFEEYHGPNPPSEGKWKQVGTGPKGGKIWERVSEERQAKPESKQAWHDKDVETVLGSPFSKMNPMWFHNQEAASSPFMKLHVKDNGNGTYDAYLQSKDHEHLKSHVSSGKDAEDTMNNIWRAGVLSNPQGEEMRRIVVDGINKEKKTGNQATPEAKSTRDLSKGKAADRLKPKPEGWGESAIIPGNTHRGVWNIATSTGYNRAKPLIDEAARIYSLGDKATDADVRALAEKIANTTGQDALYTLAQAAGVSGGGGAKAVAQRIVAPLKRDVGELPENDMTKEAALQKEAVKSGVPKAEARKLTAYARQLRDTANKQIDYHNDALKYAYSILSRENGGRSFTQHHPAFEGDSDAVKGFDTAANEVNAHYPGLFGTLGDSGAETRNNDSDAQKLWDALAAGPRQRQTINDTFPQVLDDWHHYQSQKKPEGAVPFAEIMQVGGYA